MGFFYAFSGKSSISIGRDIKNDIVIDDSLISRVHLIVNIFDDKKIAGIRIAGSNGAVINGMRHERGDNVVVGILDEIVLGKAVLVLLNDYLYFSKGSCQNVVTKREFVLRFKFVKVKQISFSPAIRKNMYYDTSPIEIEGPPARKLPEKPSIALAALPALIMAIPIMLGAGRKISIITSIGAAVWAVANVVGRQRKFKNEEKRRKNSYLGYISSCREQAAKQSKECIRALNYNYQVVAKHLTYGGNPFLVWNKDLSGNDGLLIRVGMGNIDNPISIKVPKEKFAQIDDSLKQLPIQVKEDYSILENVPICIDFASVEVLGILYDDESLCARIISALIMQFAVLAPPDAIRICAAFSSDSLKRKFGWMKYLPHSYEDESIKGNKQVASQYEGKSLCITDDLRLVGDAYNDINSIVVLMRHKLSDISSLADLLMVIKKDYKGIVSIKDKEGATFNTNEGRTLISYDTLLLRECEEYARQLACMHQRSNKNEREIRKSVDFGEMFDSPLGEDNIINNWKTCDVTREIRFPIGIGQNDKITYLDLHERAAGPHGILAGSTGSGKSELLTTIILSMAVMYPPDKVGFLLIDYKGGGMSNLFNRLPHLLGNISNLSPGQSHRALVSLNSENIKRQRIFEQSGVNNINDYIRLYDAGKVSMPLPHVFVIIDEFAQLRKEQPEYMDQLISIAAVGRSLGIHLLLATQKPGGVIDDKIRSNSKFRICLRVEEISDSQDMLRTKDAAYIRECGRGYLQVGNDEIYEQFQSGYAMSLVEAHKEGTFTILDAAYRQIDTASYDKNGLSNTSLDVSYEDSISQNWYEYCMKSLLLADEILKVKKESRLWMNALPETIFTSWDFERKAAKSFVYAIADDIWNQKYEELRYYLNESSNIHITGSAQSGRSTLIATILAGICGMRIFEEISYYIVDCGGGALSVFNKSYGCGGYISELDKSKIPMMLYYIRDLISERRRKCTLEMDSRVNNEGDQNVKDNDFYKVVLVIDNYQESVKECSILAEEVLGDIIKYGKNTSISVIVSSLNVSGVDVPARLSSQMDRTIILGNGDAYMNASLLKCRANSIIKVVDVPGRGICSLGEEVCEMQVLLSSLKGMPRDNGIITEYDAKDCITQIVNRGNKYGKKAKVYAHVPDDKGIDKFLIRAIAEVTPSDVLQNGQLPVGYEEVTGRLYTLDIHRLSAVMVCGKKGTGRKSFLECLSLVANRYEIACIKADSYDELTEVLDSYNSNLNDHQSMIVTIQNLDQIMDEISLKVKDSISLELIEELFDNTKRTNKGICVVSIVSDRLRGICQNNQIYEAIMKKPYVISFGGNLDDNRLFDYSYLPYSVQNKKKSSGTGTVCRFDNKSFYGDVIIPYIENEEM